jgi:predicted transcriptional regulator
LQNEIAGQDIAMGTMKKPPRYNVVSLRISDAEKETLTEIARRMDRSISDVMREAVELVQTEMGKGIITR